jgi:hypothetical protein
MIEGVDRTVGVPEQFLTLSIVIYGSPTKRSFRADLLVGISVLGLREAKVEIFRHGRKLQYRGTVQVSYDLPPPLSKIITLCWRVG